MYLKSALIGMCESFVSLGLRLCFVFCQNEEPYL